MIAAAMIGMTFGFGLGLRFKVVLLVPLVVMLGVAALCTVLAGQMSGWQAGEGVLIASLALEFGYGVSAGIFGVRHR